MAKAPARPSTKRKTKTTRSTAKTAPKTAAKPAAEPAPKVALTVVTDTPAAAEAPGLVLRKKDFIERVVARSGAKRGDVRALADALLEELGAALAGNETLVLPPLGKLRVARSVDRDSAEMLVVKIRRPKPGTATSGAAQSADNAPEETGEEA